MINYTKYRNIKKIKILNLIKFYISCLFISIQNLNYFELYKSIFCMLNDISFCLLFFLMEIYSRIIFYYRNNFCANIMLRCKFYINTSYFLYFTKLVPLFFLFISRNYLYSVSKDQISSHISSALWMTFRSGYLRFL